ncbi:hypothetical protein L1887_23166 [Cichorium endivia]|nr:hypothetical protein L1887_23166 [Cichorium endivia]
MADNDSQSKTQNDGADNPSMLSSNLYMDQVGEICLTLKPDELFWKLTEVLYNEDRHSSSCCGIHLASKSETSIKLSDVYAVEFIDWGSVHETNRTTLACMSGQLSEMYRFRVHGVQRSKAQPPLWSPIVHTFGHEDKQTCEMWVNQIQTFLGMETDRPKSLLVFVNPWSGKRKGCRIWKNVAPLFSQAKVKTKVIVTERAGHAFDAMNCITNQELNSYDGVVSVGGDGSFNEILNAVLVSRHKAPYPPVPPDHGPTVTMAGPPVLSSSLDESQVANLNGDSETSFPNERFRFGLIPCGSGDTVVICTTGARDPVTSALQIILGERLRLDIARIVIWKTSRTSIHEPRVRYTAACAGYGFVGDVLKESEKYRWMGPRRYDYAGAKVKIRHRSYEAEVAYIKVEPEKTDKGAYERRKKAFRVLSKEPQGVVCHAKCDVCNMDQKSEGLQESNLVRVKGQFLSINVALIPCRNERAPDGLFSDAHLADGFLHLILVKDCPRALHSRHLGQLARKGGNSLNFDFVEHHKTTTFTFTSFGAESAWHADGEVFLAHKLSTQVFRGLVNVFASGPFRPSLSELLPISPLSLSLSLFSQEHQVLNPSSSLELSPNSTTSTHPTTIVAQHSQSATTAVQSSRTMGDGGWMGKGDPNQFVVPGDGGGQIMGSRGMMGKLGRSRGMGVNPMYRPPPMGMYSPMVVQTGSHREHRRRREMRLG